MLQLDLPLPRRSARARSAPISRRTIKRPTYRGFARNPDGSWTCIADSTIEWSKGSRPVMPGERFVPGVKFMHVDLAALLDTLAGFAPHHMPLNRCA